MKKQIYIAINLLLLAFLLFTGTAMAQKDSTRLKQEVEVTKAYQPTILDAVKINDIPKIKAEQTEAPVFDYSIYSKPIFSTFEPTPVEAAKMVGDPRPEMGNGLLKLGFGNYLTPYGELFFNAQPDKNSNFGMHFKHLSSSGKISLLNGDKVDIPQSENQAEIFGKKFFHGSSLSGNLAYDRKAFNYYGYTGNELSDLLKEQMIPTQGDKQYFSKGTLDVHWKSETLSKDVLNFELGLNTHYLTSKTGQKELQTIISGDLRKKFGNMLGILNFSITNYQADSIRSRFSDVIGSKNQIIYEANPSVKWKSETASFQVGVNSALVLDDDTEGLLTIWPMAKAEWSPVERILTLFAGLDGHLQHNTYSSIVAENPYVDPFHDVANTEYKTVISGGLKGKLSSKTNYVAATSWSVVKDQHFYLTKSESFYYVGIMPRTLNNTFDWVYDDVNILKLSGDVMHSVSDEFSLHLLANYYSYNLKTQAKAWQMPNFDLTFSGIYKASEQLKFTTDIFVVGKRTAVIMDDSVLSSSSTPVPHEINMKPIIDLNAGAEYQFNGKLKFFVKLNNFGFQKYEQWLGYTSKGFNWLAGASYSF